MYTIKKILATDDALAPLVLRVPLGLMLMPHGAQKLFGWFGGYGLDGTGQWMASFGLEPGWLMAMLAGSAELFGGLALVLGLLTRPAAAAIAFAMLVAMFAVHWPSGFFITNGGYEYALALAVAAVSLLVSGGGRASLDRKIVS